MGDLRAVYDVYDIGQILRMKTQFKMWLEHMVEAEKRFCQKRSRKRLMTPEGVDHTYKLLDKCSTPWHIEALRRFLQFENIVPTIRAIELYAQKIKLESRSGMRKRKIEMV